MQTFPVDGLKLTILMIAGGVFALAGIWIMLRAKQEGSSARLELFGLKFEASSAGIIVFLIGSVFLAAPMFVPERPREALPPDKAPPPVVGPVINPPPVAVPQPVNEGSLRPPPVDLEEVEENNSTATATIVKLGQTVSGKSRESDVDWYVVAVDPKSRQDLRILFRNKGGASCPQLVILDGVEKVVIDRNICEITNITDVAIESDRYFVHVYSRFGNMTYELAFSYKPK